LKAEDAGGKKCDGAIIKVIREEGGKDHEERPASC